MQSEFAGIKIRLSVPILNFVLLVFLSSRKDDGVRESVNIGNRHPEQPSGRTFPCGLEASIRRKIETQPSIFFQFTPFFSLLRASESHCQCLSRYYRSSFQSKNFCCSFMQIEIAHEKL